MNYKKINHNCSKTTNNDNYNDEKNHNKQKNKQNNKQILNTPNTKHNQFNFIFYISYFILSVALLLHADIDELLLLLLLSFLLLVSLVSSFFSLSLFLLSSLVSFVFVVLLLLLLLFDKNPKPDVLPNPRPVKPVFELLSLLLNEKSPNENSLEFQLFDKLLPNVDVVFVVEFVSLLFNLRRFDG